MWLEIEWPEASSDESGKGDFFGGIHVCACYVDALAFEKLKNHGLLSKIKDSKKISNINIKKLATDLMCILEGNMVTVSIDVRQFNDYYQKLQNLNAVTAYIHNLTWVALLKKTKISKCKKVLDDFCTEKKYYEYLDNAGVKNVVKIDEFIYHAESKYLSCAIASIMARYNFIQEIETLSKFGAVTIPLGCSYQEGQSVIDAFHSLQEKIGPAAIECCKKCFKTVKKLDIET